MQEKLNLEYLNTFVVAAETGKLNVTAELVYKSHSSVSTQIKKLEEQIGSSLFVRQKDTLKLTKSGETLYKYAREILKLNDSVFNVLNNDDWKGSITFGVPTDYATFFIEKIHPQLVKTFPDNHFVTFCGRSREIRRQIEENHIQIALVAVEPQFVDDIVLWEEELKWVASKDFSTHPSQPLPVALFSDNCVVNNYSLYCLKKSNLAFDIVFTSTILDNIADCVRAGGAVSLLPEGMINKDMVELPHEFLDCPYTLKMGLTWRTNLDNTMLYKITNIIHNALSEKNIRPESQ